MPATPARETIIVVHGTFAGNRPGAGPEWYAPGGAFCLALDAELAAQRSTARCWAHLQQGEPHFHWDGANDWRSRLKAGARLREQIQRLHADGWRVHLVAHSHGGNVVLKAITDRQKNVEPWFVARVALLGTPIYRGAGVDAGSQRANWWRILSMFLWAIVLYVSGRRLDFAAAFQVGGPAEAWAMAATVLLVIVTVVLVVRTSRRVQGWLRTPLAAKGTTRWSPPFLLISSEYDEAYRALAGLPNAPNPLLRETPSPSAPEPAAPAAAEPTPHAPGPRVSVRFTSAVREVTDAVRTRTAARITATLDTPRAAPPLLVGFSLVIMLLFWQAACQRILSAPLDAAWAPVGYLGVLVVAITAACFSTGALLFPAMGILEPISAIGRWATSLLLLAFDGPIRRFVWDTMKSLGLGLSGAADSADDIAVARELPVRDSVYLELPTDLVAAVQARQATHGTTIHQLVYRPGLVWSPLALVKELESIDFPLVHSSYYSDAECIRKVADWMCEPLVQEFDGIITHSTLQAVGARYGGFQNMIGGEIESSNHYEDHVNDLREKYGPSKTPWGTGTRLLGFRALQSLSENRTPPPPRSRFDGPPPSLPRQHRSPPEQDS